MLVPGDSWKIEPGSFIWKNALRDCCTWSQDACQAKRHLAGTSIAAGPMHSVFNRTNNDNGIAAALLNGELYRVGILIAIVTAHRRTGTGCRVPTAQQGLPTGTRFQTWQDGALADQLLNTAVGVGNEILDVTTDQQEISPCNTINRTH
jgi:hypothetical protein